MAREVDILKNFSLGNRYNRGRYWDRAPQTPVGPCYDQFAYDEYSVLTTVIIGHKEL